MLDLKANMLFVNVPANAYKILFKRKLRESGDAMSKVVSLYGKYVEIQLSTAAERALQQRSQPLLVEMELLFSCFVTKRVHFRAWSQAAMLDYSTVAYSERLVLSFYAHVVSTCEFPPRTLLHDIQPVKNLKPYIPKWCRLDFKQGEWQGEFSYLGNESRFEAGLFLENW